MSRSNLNISTPWSHPTSQHHGRTPLLTIMVAPHFSTSWSDPTSHHHGRTPLLNTMVGPHFSLLNTMVGPHFSPSWLHPTSQHHGRTPLLTIMVGPHFSPSWSDPTSQHHGRTLTSTVSLNGRQPSCLSTWPKVNSQLPCFSKSSNSHPISSGHDVIHTPASFPIWGLLWQL